MGGVGHRGASSTGRIEVGSVTKTEGGEEADKEAEQWATATPSCKDSNGKTDT
jgi:hypothetical protein